MAYGEVTPILDSLLESGDIYADKIGQLVGIASDGTHVAIGNTDRAHVAETYLENFRTPEDW